MDQRKVFRLRVANDDIVLCHQKHIEDFTLCREGLAAARRTKNQTVGRFELLAVCKDHVAGSSVQAVIQRLAALEKFLRDKRNKNCHGRSGQTAFDPDLVDAQRQRRHKPLLLLKVQPHQMTVVLLRHRGSPEDIVLQLLLCVRHIDYQEGHQEHSLIPALQITEDVLCFTCIGGKVGGDDVHIEPFPRRPLLSVDLHTVQIGDLALDSFDGFILIHAADMDADKNAAVRVKQIGKHPVIEFRGCDLQKADRADFAAHLKPPCFAKPKRGRRNEILDRQAGGRQPLPRKGKRISVWVKDTVQHRQPLLAIQHLCQCAHGLKVIQGIQHDPGKTGFCLLAVLCFNGQHQEFCLDHAVVAVFQLPAEHIRVEGAYRVELVLLRRDLNSFAKIRFVHLAANKG